MHVVIVGNGVAGVTAARHLRKRSATARITMISGESDYHWSRPALMYLYMGHLRPEDVKPYPDEFWSKNRIELRRGWVVGADTQASTVSLSDGHVMSYDCLLLATGSIPNRFGWPGQDLERVQGLYSLQDLMALEHATAATRHAVIVGGGLIGVELAEMLLSRGRSVTFLVRESRYWGNVLPAEEALMVERVIRRAGVDLRLGVELERIEDDGLGGAGAVWTSAGERITCQLVGLTAGVRPRTELAVAAGLTVARGVEVDSMLRTSRDNVFACGDCAEIVMPDGNRVLEQVWYTGRAQGEVAAANILGEAVEYRPGIWFNSAKFFELEHQVYGDVPRDVSGDAQHLYWEDPHADRAVRIVHRDGRVVGINLMGVRMRHRVCEDWIARRRRVEEVMPELRRAMFDPEFEPDPTPAIQAAWRGR